MGHGGSGGEAGWKHEWTEEEYHRHQVRMYSTWAGIVLCIVLFVYLTRLAKKALARAQAQADGREGQGAMPFLDRETREVA